ncbi:arginine/serine-rich coiled-coil protein 2-like [Ischnura elegans]|uniref:arginine/serine-rich coiled-coil protein 2-like n=1 Tax=Ischnura elegans TaxID=197161 RepID=UPI001ED8BC72|nr:arginine/serine-rich coiled-coil protein 2-like [Ischnura elegans]
MLGESGGNLVKSIVCQLQRFSGSGPSMTTEDIRSALKKAITSGSIVPVSRGVYRIASKGEKQQRDAWRAAGMTATDGGRSSMQRRGRGGRRRGGRRHSRSRRSGSRSRSRSRSQSRMASRRRRRSRSRSQERRHRGAAVDGVEEWRRRKAGERRRTKSRKTMPRKP